MAKEKKDGKKGGRAERRASAVATAKRGAAKGSATAGGAKKAKKRAPRFTAETADKYVLYQHAVQSPDEDARFLRRVYKAVRGKPAHHLREDFCGTALLASEWVSKGTEYTAEGFDIDPEPVAWGIEHNFGPLGEGASRCKLHLKDVREPSHRAPDIRTAFNFSYHILKTRQEMLGYFRAAHADLAPDGLFVLDMHGGPEAMEEMEEERKIDEGFTYVWDQERFWPATGEYRCHIHFEFKDGTRMDRAFSYDWRLWTMPEIVDCLREAGFATVETYWEGTDENGEDGNGVFKKKRRGENCPSWIAYIVAEK